MTRGVMIAAPRSGGGKTVVTLALLAALRRRGVRVGAAKSGPDYIDPAFHAAVCGRASFNLDSWAMGGEQLDAGLGAAAEGAEILLVESAMGLFDGLSGPEGARGAASDLAGRYGVPVVLVLDVSGQGQSVAAVARGFMGFAAGVRVVGVILNRVASDRHLSMVRGALEAAGVPVLGGVRRSVELALPERHLGLVQAREGDLSGFWEQLAEVGEASLDVDAILRVAGDLDVRGGGGTWVRPPGQRIAVAQDDAFSFLYPHLVAGWRAAGAEIVPFSPLADEGPGEGCDACWLPGGYPELHAGRLAGNEGFLGGVRGFARERPVHGECGGYMVLGEALVDGDGVSHRMAGLLGHVTSFASRRLHLGYRHAVLCESGVVWRGHEFHYATEVEHGGDLPFALLRDGMGEEIGAAGGRRGLVSGSFFHVIAERTA